MTEQTAAGLLTDAFSEVELDVEHLHFDESTEAARGNRVSAGVAGSDEDGDQEEAEEMWTASCPDPSANQSLTCQAGDARPDSGEDPRTEPDPLDDLTREPELSGQSDAEDEMKTEDEEEACFGQRHVEVPQWTDISISTDNQQTVQRIPSHDLPRDVGPDSRHRQEPDDTGHSGNRDPSWHLNIMGSLALSDDLPELLDEEQLREFLEEDQEKIGEDLADYPSDLSQNEDQDSGEKSEQDSTDMPENQATLSNSPLKNTENMGAENYSNKGLDQETYRGQECLEGTDSNIDWTDKDTFDNDCEAAEAGSGLEQTNEREHMGVGLGVAATEGDGNKESVGEDCTTVEDQGGTEDVTESNDPPADGSQLLSESDIRSDDSGAGQEHTGQGVSIENGQNQNEISQDSIHSNFTVASPASSLKATQNQTNRPHGPENRVGTVVAQSDAACSCVEAELPRKARSTLQNDSHHEDSEKTEMYPSQVKSHHPVTEEHSKLQQETFDSWRNTAPSVLEALSSSSLFRDEDESQLKEFDWDLEELSGGVQVSQANCHNQTGREDRDRTVSTTEYASDDDGDEGDDDDEDDDDDDDGEAEEQERNWELEKARIEAFYRFYSNTDDLMAQEAKKAKVSFCVEPEPSSSSVDESDSSILTDDDVITPVTSSEPEAQSEGQEPAANPPTRTQAEVDAAQRAPSQRNRCPGLLKPALSLGVVLGLGVWWFWWSTEQLAQVH